LLKILLVHARVGYRGLHLAIGFNLGTKVTLIALKALTGSRNESFHSLEAAFHKLGRNGGGFDPQHQVNHNTSNSCKNKLRERRGDQ
jgi:hypothetical protein